MNSMLHLNNVTDVSSLVDVCVCVCRSLWQLLLLKFEGILFVGALIASIETISSFPTDYWPFRS